MGVSRPVSDFLAFLNQRAPLGSAEEWDNVGLLVGDSRWKTAGAVVSIDLTEEALQAAIRKGYRLIVNHHPCIFPRSRGLSRVICGEGLGMSDLVARALQSRIAVVSCHTNFDRCALEVVRAVSEGLAAVPGGRLHDSAEALLKLAVFVPSTHVDSVREAICEAGAGVIGNYDRCTFAAEGEGTFRGAAGTRPFLGRPGALERARETRLETIVPRGLEKAVLKALLAAHPYEEVAYDLLPLEQAPPVSGVARGLGYGFWGDLAKPVSIRELGGRVRSMFKASGYLLTGKPPARIRRIGFVAGKGESFIGSAASAGCELFITGEAGYHAALDASRKGMSVLEIGHRESERYFLSTMKSWVAQAGFGAIELNVPTQSFGS